jgi:multidrug efflux pump subunit AcrA (membrane-fusion protein)
MLKRTLAHADRPGRTGSAVHLHRPRAPDPDRENPDGEVLLGAYVVVRPRVGLATRGMTNPANALLFRSEGLRVTVVRNGRAELVPVKLGRDYGRSVEVVAGLTPADAVILDPADSLVSGTAVRVRPSAPSKKGG